MRPKLDPSVTVLARVALRAVMHRLVCGFCGGTEILDGPHAEGRYLCANCLLRTNDLRSLQRPCEEHCGGCA